MPVQMSILTPGSAVQFKPSLGNISIGDKSSTHVPSSLTIHQAYSRRIIKTPWYAEHRRCVDKFPQCRPYVSLGSVHRQPCWQCFRQTGLYRCVYILPYTGSDVAFVDRCRRFDASLARSKRLFINEKYHRCNRYTPRKSYKSFKKLQVPYMLMFITSTQPSSVAARNIVIMATCV